MQIERPSSISHPSPMGITRGNPHWSLEIQAFMQAVLLDGLKKTLEGIMSRQYLRLKQQREDLARAEEEAMRWEAIRRS